MDHQQLEAAVKSDLITLSTLKMETVSAKDFYGPVLMLVFKISFIFLGINTIARMALHQIGQYQPPMTLGWMFGAWICALGTSFLLGLSLSRLVLIAKLFRNRLKTGVFLKQKYLHFSLMFFLIYSGMYLVTTDVVGIGMDEHALDIDIVTFSTIFAQVFAFVVAIVTTGFLSMLELDRLGLAILWNALGEFVRKAKSSSKVNRGSKDSEYLQ